jgi:predicted MFS family arabinose efflux permease
VCLAALALAWRGLPSDSPERAAGATQQRATAPPAPASAHHSGAPSSARLDVIGLLLLCPALAGLLYGLAQAGTSSGFGHPKVVIPVAVGLALLGAFVAHALRTTSEPLVSVRLFRSPSFAGASGLLFLAGLSIYGAMLLLPLYFEQARGYSALAAGLMLVPQGIGSILPRTIVGKLTDRIGPRPVTLAGVMLAAVGTVPFALAGTRTSSILLAAALVVRGAGLGAATIAVMAGAFQGLSRSELPHASSATRIMQQVGGAFGAAVLVVILTRQAASQPIVVAFGQTFWWCTGFTVLALAPALLLPGRPRAADPSSGTRC